jgi:hypothetical protein
VKLRAALAERSILGAVLESPAVWAKVVAALQERDFSLESHKLIFAVMKDLARKGEPLDLISVVEQLDRCGDLERIGDVAYVSGLVDGSVPESVQHHIMCVREAARDRQFLRLHEQLGGTTNGDRLPLLNKMQALLTPIDSQDWRSIFHTFEDFEKAPPLSFAIDGFLPADGISLIGGLSGHGKTLAMLAMTRSLITGENLFGWEAFTVPKPASRVLYLIPESSISPFWQRLKLFRLEQFLRDGRLLVRTLSHRQSHISLDDHRLLLAAEGAICLKKFFPTTFCLVRPESPSS